MQRLLLALPVIQWGLKVGRATTKSGAARYLVPIKPPVTHYHARHISPKMYLMKSNQVHTMKRGPQVMPTRDDRRRWILALRERADQGDPESIRVLLDMDGRTDA